MLEGDIALLGNIIIRHQGDLGRSCCLDLDRWWQSYQVWFFFFTFAQMI